METIKIISATDSRYVQHLGVMFVSLLENTSFEGGIELYVIDGGITSKDKEMLKLSISNYNCKIHFLEIKPDLFERFPESPSASTATYFRIFVPELLDTSIEKAIYLDCDIVVLGDVEELWNVDISENFVAAVEDCGIEGSGWYSMVIKRRLGMKRNDTYFNAGVLVMNLTKLREYYISEKVRDFLLENPDKLDFADQDALNAVLCNNWLPLHQVWNQQGAHCEFFEKNMIFNVQMVNAVKNPKIVHYTTTYYITTKPWTYKDSHPYKKEYYRYLSITPWKSFIPSDYSLKNVIVKRLSGAFAGKLIMRYIRFVKPNFTYETSKISKKITGLLAFKLIYYMLFPVGYVYMNFFSRLARTSCEFEKRNKMMPAISLKLIYILLFPSRYLVYKYIRESIKNETYQEKYNCPCCGYKTLRVKPPQTNEICEICNWEYDIIQSSNPDSTCGANNVSLNQARKNYLAFGASEKKYIYFVRKPGHFEKNTQVFPLI